ncbi:glycosyltransferase family 4 protein [Psychroflexus salinarum]|uniref:Glycosyltransferase family 4 protein n=1 Tax=Psychroflexus salinarum TaxID=546024 RepID=A0ABW3GXQ9_9FLAO
MIYKILHPFTPKAAGVVEKSVMTYHSQPHLKAFQLFAEKHPESKCSIDYFTHRLFKYSTQTGQINYNFYPVDFDLKGDYKKWKKQKSTSCLKAYKSSMPDVTIINMSGHSSKFSHVLAKEILDQGKKYVAMLGGQHYTDTISNKEYNDNADHILVHTHLQKAEMESLDQFKGLDIRVFPLGVDTSYFKPNENLNLNKDPKLLYVGRIIEWKRVHLAIEAVKVLVDHGFQNAKLDIIGPVFSEVYNNKLHELVEELNIKSNISFLGHKEHHELIPYFQEADLFTLPSNKETFGMVMIEAMACGTPVAGIDCPGGPKDVIANQENGLLSSPDTYSEVILEYFQNTGHQDAIKRNAILKVQREFSIEKTFEVLEKSLLG